MVVSAGEVCWKVVGDTEPEPPMRIQYCHLWVNPTSHRRNVLPFPWRRLPIPQSSESTMMDGSRGWSRICGLGRTLFLHSHYSQLFLYSISLFPRGETFKSISAGRKNEHYLLHWCECQTPLFLKKANIEVIKSVLWVRRTDTVHVTCPQHACIPKKLIEKVYCGPQRAASLQHQE